MATRDRNGTDVVAGDIIANADLVTATQGDRPPAPDPLETPQNYATGDKVRLASPGLVGFSCHCIPALTTANNGWIIASWDGCPNTCRDTPQANSIVCRISKDGGKSWTPIKTVLVGTPGARKIGYSDPSFVVDRTTGTIFLFSVKSYDVGLSQSQLGIDPAARNTLHVHVVESHDNGETWRNPRTITDQVTAGYEDQQFTCSASSGEGIQLRYGVYVGRLIQQYAVTNFGTTSLVVVSVYSDDRGVTWKPGALTEGSADKSKVVELSDGRLLLNSRTQDIAGQRLETVSYNGGQTWGPLRHSWGLTDPRNNASVVYAYPDAPKDSARVRVLLLSSADSASARVDGTIRISHDDGLAWNDGKVFESGETVYLTLHPLGNGTQGLLYESGGCKNIEFMRLDVDYLDLTDPGEEDAPESESTSDPQPWSAPEPNPTVTPAHWANTGSGWKRQLEDSSYVMNQTIIIGEATYRFGADGMMVTGWDNQGGVWSHYNAYGTRASGWLADAGSWYYLGPTIGAMATGQTQIDGTWYLFSASDVMLTGWQHAGDWYHLAPSGAILTGRQHIDAIWYYLAGGGHMVTGWQTIDECWYYFASSGARI